MGPLSLLAATWCLAVAAVTARAALPRARPPRRHRPIARRIVVVRPCAGDESRLRESLATTAAAAKAVGAGVRFAIATPDDPAWAAVQSACDLCTRAGLDARVVITHAVGPNRKADQIARVLAGLSAAPDVVVLVDSDVALGPGDLRALLAPLDDPAVAAAWAPPVEIAPTTLADRASAAVLASSLHAFAVLADLDPRGMVGKLVAVRAAALDAIGGMDALVPFLGEDMELAARLHQVGFAVRVADVRARSLASSRDARAIVARYARWISVIRAQRPALLASYPLLFAAAPLVVMLSLVAALLEGPHGLAIAAGAIATRLLAATVARARTGIPEASSRLVDVALADALLLAAFASALHGGGEVIWRGGRLYVGPGGRLVRRESLS